MEFRILGPLEVLRDGKVVDLGHAKQRAVLGVLLLHRGDVVSTERLIDELWGESPPPTATKVVQVYVSRLRKALDDAAAARLCTQAPGYVFEPGPDVVDADRFESLVAEARRTGENDDVAEAAANYREALALWRGRALGDLTFESFAANETERLNELRLEALTERIDCDLRLGRHGELVGELEALVAEHPLRESLRGQLMLALYRSGRQADALEAYIETRRALRDELGLEPGPELRRLEQEILRHDEGLQVAEPRSLEAKSAPLSANGRGRKPAMGKARDGGNSASAGSRPATGAAVQRSTRRHLSLVTVAVAVGVIAAAAAGVFLVISGGNEAPELEPNEIALIDPDSGRVLKQLAVPAEPTGIVEANGAVWASAADGTLSRAELSGNGVVERYRPTRDVTALTAGARALWLVDAEQRRVVRFDPLARKAVQRIAVGNGANAVAVGDGSVWVTNGGDGTVTRIDARSGRVRQKISVGGLPSGIAVGGRSVWVSDAENNAVIELDARSGRPVGAVAVGKAPLGIAAFGNTVWVANTRDSTVSRIDGTRGAVTTTITVPGGAAAVAALVDRIWVAGAEGSVVTEIDTTGHVRQVARGARPITLARVGQSVAVATGEPLASHRGGTVRIVGGESGDLVTLDPRLGGRVRASAFLPSRTTACSATGDRRARPARSSSPISHGRFRV